MKKDFSFGFFNGFFSEVYFNVGKGNIITEEDVFKMELVYHPIPPSHKI
jgi:hypothetical protein